jgi:non-ribosomal peptide synthetase component F
VFGADAGEAVLGVAATEADGRPALRVTYRRDALDADAAARIAGYHLTALHRLVSEPDTAIDRHTLLSAEEIAFQIDGLAGPHLELPDHRFLHELFEQRVRTHPDAVAAECAGRRWTYRELNARANQIGHALLARGLGREGVVAVTTERNLDWMASVHRDLQGGRVYLPVEPHLPADRIAGCCAAPRSRSCSPSRAARPPSTRRCTRRPQVQRLLIADAYAEDHPTPT